MDISDRDDELRSLSGNIIKGLLSDMFLAGTETSSSTIVWGMTEILRTPDAYKKIVMELDQVVGKDRFVGENDIPNSERSFPDSTLEPLAHRMVHFYLAALLHAFEWECPLEILNNMEEGLGLTIQKDKSLIAIPKPGLPTSVYL
ncbi:Cytochrome P450 76C1 [Prunus dulcis]|uniref:Cytochrome P450 76C1 n=1 Tax=Prunus dulcis TaxID=3755 RepID=A0A4Y1QLE9_PRUDU|nr:Cytochrome P450 76C1 [Prunus dulcis]